MGERDGWRLEAEKWLRILTRRQATRGQSQDPDYKLWPVVLGIAVYSNKHSPEYAQKTDPLEGIPYTSL